HIAHFCFAVRKTVVHYFAVSSDWVRYRSHGVLNKNRFFLGVHVLFSFPRKKRKKNGYEKEYNADIEIRKQKIS
nr:hypothetical protein [Candidatus Gastranaerophilales bacterium]